MKKPTHIILICVLGIILQVTASHAVGQGRVKAIGNYLCINYRPFFPIGLYSFPDGRYDDAMWKEVSGAGFNFVLSNESGKYGMYVSRAIPTKTIDGVRVSLMETYRDPSLLNELIRFLDKYENDTTLLCWHAPDEPGWYGPSGVALFPGYEAIKDHSKKPVWLNNGPYLAPHIVNFSRPVEMTRPCDILSEDIYPIPEGKGKPSQGDNFYASYVGEDTKMLVDMVSVNGIQEKPVWMVLQGFNWGDLGRSDPRFKDFLPPNKHELRFMTYDAIVHGATGILWWGVRNTKTEVNARLWNDLKAMASELKRTYSLWTCPFELVPDKLDISIPAMHRGENPVHYVIKLTNNKAYILAVNTRNIALSNVSFSVARDRGVVTKVNVLEENREIKVSSNNAWTDSFEGYAVHIYETDIYYSFMRRYYKETVTEKATK